MNQVTRCLSFLLWLIAPTLGCLQGTAAAQTTDPARLYAEGVERLDGGDWAGAISRFEAVLAGDPGHLPSWFNLGVAHTELGEDQPAIEAYRKAVELDGAVFETRMNLAILLEKTGEIAGALEEVTVASGLRPADPVPFLFRGELLERSNRIPEAIEAYQGAITLAPTDPDPVLHLGSLYSREGRIDEAYETLEGAVELGASGAALFVSLGDLAVERELYEAAREHYARALEHDPDDGQTSLRLGLVLERLGLYAEAIPILAGLEVKDAGAALAETYLAADRFEDAAAVYADLTASEPEEIEHWLGLGRARYELRQYAQALPALLRVIGMDPDRALALGMLAGIYYEQDDLQNSAAMLLRRLELIPDDANAHFMLATVLDRLQNPGDALLHYNKFLELDDGSDDARTFQVRQRVRLLEELLP